MAPHTVNIVTSTFDTDYITARYTKVIAVKCKKTKKEMHSDWWSSRMMIVTTFKLIEDSESYNTRIKVKFYLSSTNHFNLFMSHAYKR